MLSKAIGLKATALDYWHEIIPIVTLSKFTLILLNV